MLATLISFSNELANLGAAIGNIDTVDVMRGLHLARYLSPLENGKRIEPSIVSFLMAGCAFGGSCLPKDVSALVAHGKSFGIPMEVLAAVLAVNSRQPAQIFKLLGKHFPSLKGTRVTLLGLSFRPDTDDMRESPAIPIIRRLLEEGASVTAYDPAAIEEARRLFGERITLASTLEAALDNADAVVLVTRWKEFERVPELLKKSARPPVFVDGRRMLEKSAIARYEGIGL